jgi:hypothetical protein
MKWRFKCCSRTAIISTIALRDDERIFATIPTRTRNPAASIARRLSIFRFVRVTSSTRPLRGEIILAAQPGNSVFRFVDGGQVAHRLDRMLSRFPRSSEMNQKENGYAKTQRARPS